MDYFDDHDLFYDNEDSNDDDMGHNSSDIDFLPINQELNQSPLIISYNEAQIDIILIPHGIDDYCGAFDISIYKHIKNINNDFHDNDAIANYYMLETMMDKNDLWVNQWKSAHLLLISGVCRNYVKSLRVIIVDSTISIINQYIQMAPLIAKQMDQNEVNDYFKY